jgi:hypothetical protein
MQKGDYRKIHTRHAGAYKILMRALVDFHGSINKALKAVGINDNAYYRLMNDDAIVVHVARKIVDSHSAIAGAHK